MDVLKGLDDKTSAQKPLIRLNKSSKDKSGDVDSKNIALGKRRRMSKKSKLKLSPAKAKVLVKVTVPARAG